MEIKSALVIRDSSLGDVVCCEPFIRGLEKLGYNHICVQGEIAEQIFKHHPLVSNKKLNEFNNIFNLNDAYEEIGRQKFLITDDDWLFRLWTHFYDGVELIQKSYFKKYDINFHEGRQSPKLYVSKKETDWAKSFLDKSKKLIAIDTGSYFTKDTRRKFQGWSAENWDSLFTKLIDSEYNIVLLGINPYQTFNISEHILDLRGKTDLRQLMAVLSVVDFYIGPDTGTIHIAQALDIAGVALFGLINPKTRIAPGTKILPIICRNQLPIEQISTALKYTGNSATIQGPDMSPLSYFDFSKYNISYKESTSENDIKIGWSVDEFNCSSEILREFDIISVKNLKSLYPWVPCPSCMDSAFNKDYKILHKFAIYENSNNSLNIKRIPKCSSLSPKIAASFIGSAKYILTNSYYGCYWGALLKRRVIAFTKNCDFDNLKFKPAICLDDNWMSIIDQTTLYPEALSISRTRNIEFYEKIIEVLN